MEAEQIKADAERTRALYQIGAITYDEAKKRLQPYAKLYNETSQRLAKKYGQRASCFSFASYIR